MGYVTALCINGVRGQSETELKLSNSTLPWFLNTSHPLTASLQGNVVDILQLCELNRILKILVIILKGDMRCKTFFFKKTI